MYKEEAGSNSILWGLATDAESANSQLMKSLTVLPSTLTAILFQAVEREGMVNTAKGSDCNLLRDVRYSDTSWTFIWIYLWYPGYGVTCIPNVGPAVMLRPRLTNVSSGVTTENKKPPCWSAGLIVAKIAKFSNIERGRRREWGVHKSDPARNPSAGKPWSPSAKYTCFGSSKGIEIACRRSISETWYRY